LTIEPNAFAFRRRCCSWQGQRRAWPRPRPAPPQVCSIEVAKGYGAAEWREDLKRILKRAGLEGRDAVFLLADSQIIQEGFLEDVNNVLNSGGLRTRVSGFASCVSRVRGRRSRRGVAPRGGELRGG
jgi:hypothetical protein